LKGLLRAAGAGLIAILLTVALAHRFGIVPPIGWLLNPFNGSWKRTPGVFENGKGILKLKGLTAPVTIVVDRDQVKHIFAENDHDLYAAQGFILASERLWQMEFMVRTASGRLSEVMGEKALDYDIYFSRLGVPSAAQASMPLMLQDPVTGPALRAYAEGVNAYIATLTPESLPFEYKMLGHKPIEWDPRAAAYLLKFMAWNLNARGADLQLSRSAHVLGRTGFDELFPIDLKVPEPIVPTGTKQNQISTAPNAPKEPFVPSVEVLQPMPTPNPANGSNNWAVSGRKSTTGLPILSNDIHLGLGLPALWYEMQLVSPTQNVYGIALPGAPGIILGFNKSIAWGATNGGDDVLDWYQLRFRDEKRSEYLVDGTWRPVISHEIKIPVRGQPDHTLVLRDTHYGPIVYEPGEKTISPAYGVGLAAKWGTLTESNELRSFILMNRAKNIDEFRKALEGYQTPAQNFLCADNRGHIALWQMGRFPLRWKGQGRLISDGSDSAYDWKGYLLPDEVPMVKDPARGFISSANQPPYDAADAPFYLGAAFEVPYRSQRINELLRAQAKFGPRDFIKMQRDTLAVSTRELIPVLREALAHETLDPREAKALATLDKWDFRYEEDSNGAPLAHAWYKEAELGLWSRLFGDRTVYAYPPIQKTIEIFKDENSRWYDNPATDAKETRASIVHAALARAITKVEEKTGTRDPARWTWAAFRPTSLLHFGKIPGLGLENIPAAGMEHSIFANAGNHGPVWKMVVALGPKPQAFGVYPGGQSGDLFGPHATEFVNAWRKGEMKELEFMSAPNDSDTRELGIVTMEAAP
jgi:penicillin amidase